MPLNLSSEQTNRRSGGDHRTDFGKEFAEFMWQDNNWHLGGQFRGMAITFATAYAFWTVLDELPKNSWIGSAIAALP